MTQDSREPEHGESGDASDEETVESNPDTSATTDDDGTPVDNPSG